MSSPNGIERRDPASGLLKLGAVLTDARQRRRSGWLLVTDQGERTLVHLQEGRILQIELRGQVLKPGAFGSVGLQRTLERLFVLPRPLVEFDEQGTSHLDGSPLDSQGVILGGVRRREDLFDPLRLVERIPVSAVSLTQETRDRLRRMGLTEGERTFIDSLRIPTPLPMALWKRGLQPKRAGAMVMALNLVGAFENWAAGDLPRLCARADARRRVAEATDDFALLGVCPDASLEEVDRAFRKLSLSLHPDRFGPLPEAEAREAGEAFSEISAAHARLRRSRRARGRRWRSGSEGSVVIETSGAYPWKSLLDEASRAAAAGDILRARRLAVKAMALQPPKPAVEALKQLLRSVA